MDIPYLKPEVYWIRIYLKQISVFIKVIYKLLLLLPFQLLPVSFQSFTRSWRLLSEVLIDVYSCCCPRDCTYQSGNTLHHLTDLSKKTFQTLFNCKWEVTGMNSLKQGEEQDYSFQQQPEIFQLKMYLKVQI